MQVVQYSVAVIRHLTMMSFAVLAFASCGTDPDSGEGSGGELMSVPRNRTLIMDCADPSVCSGQLRDYDSFNPYLPGNVSRTGYQFLYEPLYFYNAYAAVDTLIPWIATGHEFSEDYTEVTVTIRPGVTWSDGVPWSAHDLVFTVNMLKANAPDLSFSTDMATWVDQAVAVDSLTARIQLTAANPRFIFTYFAHSFDNGVPIVPRHIWKGRDPSAFANSDPARDWPVVSGPYRLALSTPQQRIWDRRADWWGAVQGLHALPQVERLIFLTYMDESKRVQNVTANQLDTCLDLRPPNIQSIVESNPHVTTWSGREPPYGYLDWWPICLGFNALEEPFSDPDIRRAINHAIDRNQIVEVGWQGSGSASLLPFPEFPPMRRFTREIEDLVERYQIDGFDPDASAAAMTRKGWTRDAEGFWQRHGRRFSMVIDISEIFQDLAPVLVAQLQRAGFDASFRMTHDTYTRMAQGTARAYLYGNGGSVRDPYFTLRLYHSRFVQPTGTHAQYFWRWRNAEFDRLVDQMGTTDTNDPRLLALFRQAMDIWLGELPAIPLVQWYHRIPHNQTYWTGWPSAENAYINSAYWHRTWLLVLLGLRPAQEV